MGLVLELCSPSPLEESEAPGWFWDTGLDDRRLGAVYTWTDNVTNISHAPPHIYLSLKLTGPVPCKSIFIAFVY